MKLDAYKYSDPLDNWTNFFHYQVKLSWSFIDFIVNFVTGIFVGVVVFNHNQ